MAHTPGPLLYVKQPQFLGGEYEVRTAGGMEIAFVTTEDDARLFAAAPDMYEALKAAKRALSSMDISSASSEAALEKVRAALAKARAASKEG